jgi:hypothetical protein
MRRAHGLIVGLALLAAVGALIVNRAPGTTDDPTSDPAREAPDSGMTSSAVSAPDHGPGQSAAGRNAATAPQQAEKGREDPGRSSPNLLTANVVRSQLPGDSEKESWMQYRNSDYDSYDKATLLALAETGDAQALTKLFGKVDTRKLCELAGVSFQSGHPSAYGMAADLVLSSTQDRVVARAYYYVWRESGSDLAALFERDYMRRTAMSQEENQRAIALSRQLRASNDCGWAPST